jgi:carbonic anhydrase/acetyltransferase-like protein (isoleucine patch superfamily)
VASADLPQEVLDLDPFRRSALLAVSRVVLQSYRLLYGNRVRFGEGVVANHRLRISGPGAVEVADGANLYAYVYTRTCLWTRTPGARIRVGRHARLTGTLLQADTLIDIGENCLLGQAHVIDTDMHSLARDRRTNPNASVRTAPVIIERDVWVARGAAVLPGVRIGQGSVIGYGAVVTGDIPPGVLAAGNPAKVIREL